MNEFAVLSISYTPTLTAETITNITNNPSHLWLCWTLNYPIRHKSSRTLRGLIIPWSAYFCFNALTCVEQVEAGDTTIHTFLITDWPPCQTRYFIFHGTVTGIDSPSCSAIYHHHHGTFFTLIIYPDRDPETTSVDGSLAQIEPGNSWYQIRLAPGTLARPSVSGSRFAMWRCDTTINNFNQLWRSIFLFDTSSIPASAERLTAKLSFYGYTKINEGSWPNIRLNVYSSNPSFNTTLIPADYGSLADIPLCDTPIDYADFDTAGGENAFILNSLGLALVDRTGITKFGLREVTYDVAGLIPAWGSNKRLIFNGLFSDTSQPALRPRLTLDYYLP